MPKKKTVPQPTKMLAVTTVKDWLAAIRVKEAETDDGTAKSALELLGGEDPVSELISDEVLFADACAIATRHGWAECFEPDKSWPLAEDGIICQNCGFSSGHFNIMAQDGSFLIRLDFPEDAPPKISIHR